MTRWSDCQVEGSRCLGCPYTSQPPLTAASCSVGSTLCPPTARQVASCGGSLGASSIIYGLMAIALVWAPKNDVQCMFFIYFHPILFDCPILALVGFSLVVELGIWGITSAADGGMEFAITSQVLHLMGAALGAGVGVAMLKWNWVDCEGWDVFSVLAGRDGVSTEKWEQIREESYYETFCDSQGSGGRGQRSEIRGQRTEGSG